MSNGTTKSDRIIEFCRLCLGQEGPFVCTNSPHNLSLGINEKIEAICNLQINKHEILPATICKKCQDKVVEMFNFQNMCTLSNKLLHTYETVVIENPILLTELQRQLLPMIRMAKYREVQTETFPDNSFNNNESSNQVNTNVSSRIEEDITTLEDNNERSNEINNNNNSTLKIHNLGGIHEEIRIKEENRFENNNEISTPLNNPNIFNEKLMIKEEQIDVNNLGNDIERLNELDENVSSKNDENVEMPEHMNQTCNLTTDPLEIKAVLKNHIEQPTNCNPQEPAEIVNKRKPRRKRCSPRKYLTQRKKAKTVNIVEQNCPIAEQLTDSQPNTGPNIETNSLQIDIDRIPNVVNENDLIIDPIEIGMDFRNYFNKPTNVAEDPPIRSTEVIEETKVPDDILQQLNLDDSEEIACNVIEKPTNMLLNTSKKGDLEIAQIALANDHRYIYPRMNKRSKTIAKSTRKQSHINVLENSPKLFKTQQQKPNKETTINPQIETKQQFQNEVIFFDNHLDNVAYNSDIRDMINRNEIKLICSNTDGMLEVVDDNTIILQEHPNLADESIYLNSEFENVANSLDNTKSSNESQNTKMTTENSDLSKRTETSFIPNDSNVCLNVIPAVEFTDLNASTNKINCAKGASSPKRGITKIPLLTNIKPNLSNMSKCNVIKNTKFGEFRRNVNILAKTLNSPKESVIKNNSLNRDLNFKPKLPDVRLYPRKLTNLPNFNSNVDRTLVERRQNMLKISKNIENNLLINQRSKTKLATNYNNLPKLVPINSNLQVPQTLCSTKPQNISTISSNCNKSNDLQILRQFVISTTDNSKTPQIVKQFVVHTNPNLDKTTNPQISNQILHPAKQIISISSTPLIKNQFLLPAKQTTNISSTPQINNRVPNPAPTTYISRTPQISNQILRPTNQLTPQITRQIIQPTKQITSIYRTPFINSQFVNPTLLKTAPQTSNQILNHPTNITNISRLPQNYSNIALPSEVFVVIDLKPINQLLNSTKISTDTSKTPQKISQIVYPTERNTPQMFNQSLNPTNQNIDTSRPQQIKIQILRHTKGITDNSRTAQTSNHILNTTKIITDNSRINSKILPLNQPISNISSTLQISSQTLNPSKMIPVNSRMSQINSNILRPTKPIIYISRSPQISIQTLNPSKIIPDNSSKFLVLRTDIFRIPQITNVILNPIEPRTNISKTPQITSEIQTSADTKTLQITSVILNPTKRITTISKTVPTSSQIIHLSDDVSSTSKVTQREPQTVPVPPNITTDVSKPQSTSQTIKQLELIPEPPKVTTKMFINSNNNNELKRTLSTPRIPARTWWWRLRKLEAKQINKSQNTKEKLAKAKCTVCKNSNCLFSDQHTLYQCRNCDFIFKTIPNLRAHFMRVHLNPKVYQCMKCRKTFANNKKLIKHLRTHYRYQKFSCTFCGEQFDYSLSLSKHALNHNGIKRFICSYCPKGFVRKAALKLHIIQHTKEQNIPCNCCDKLFYTLKAAKAHERSHSVKAYVCDICPAKFQFKSSLNNHKKAHILYLYPLITKDFICIVCYKSFDTNQLLVTHGMEHSDLRPVVCHICRIKFMSHSSFRTHYFHSHFDHRY